MGIPTSDIDFFVKHAEAISFKRPYRSQYKDRVTYIMC